MQFAISLLPNFSSLESKTLGAKTAAVYLKKIKM